MTGQSLDKDDVDWFKFNTAAAQKITVTFSTAVPPETKRAHWKIFLYDAENNEFKNSFNGRPPFIVDLTSAGTYFFKIQPYIYNTDSFSSPQYEITVE